MAATASVTPRGVRTGALRERLKTEAGPEDQLFLYFSGHADGGELHPMQEAFRECHALQCGYCTPGMIMAACDLLKENPNPSETEIREGLEGNLCRCTGYHNIVKSVLDAAQQTKGVPA